MDREKVIKGLEKISDYFFDIYRNDTDSYKCEKAQEYSDVAIDAIALLKEQDNCENCAIAIEDRQLIVRCKDCRHRDPEDHKCDCGHDIQWQLPRADDWFCADGERE